VGIGAQASADVIESELFSSDGKSMGKGAIQKVDLKPGVYLLVLRAPLQGAPVRVRPAVVGIIPPGTGPPEEIIRGYMLPEDASQGFSSRRVTRSDAGEEEGESSDQEGTIGEVSSPEDQP
jgi:hypothetical protein